jgi:hypothetical protein
MAVAGGVALPALTSAQSPSATTMTFQEKVQSVVQDDVAPKSKSGKVSLGDRLITRQSLFDSTKQRRGTLYTDCTGIGPTKGFPNITVLCTITYSLPAGQIVASGVATFNGKGTTPIVGGTGAFAGAHGTIAMGRPAKGFDSADVITINP